MKSPMTVVTSNHGFQPQKSKLSRQVQLPTDPPDDEQQSVLVTESGNNNDGGQEEDEEQEQEEEEDDDLEMLPGREQIEQAQELELELAREREREQEQELEQGHEQELEQEQEQDQNHEQDQGSPADYMATTSIPSTAPSNAKTPRFTRVTKKPGSPTKKPTTTIPTPQDDGNEVHVAISLILTNAVYVCTPMETQHTKRTASSLDALDSKYKRPSRNSGKC